LYKRGKDSFIARVEECVTLSIQRSFINQKGSALRFTETKPQHERVRQHVLPELNADRDDAVLESQEQVQDVKGKILHDDTEKTEEELQCILNMAPDQPPAAPPVQLPDPTSLAEVTDPEQST
jgi:hypothetical protein